MNRFLFFMVVQDIRRVSHMFEITKQESIILFIVSLSSISLFAQNAARRDTTHDMADVVVTGTKTAADIRQLPQTVTIVGRDVLTTNERTSVMPTLMEQVPGLLVTGRGMMGYGVSTGGTGGMMLRGISSSAGQLMVLIDGHPQYSGIYGHSIADSYQTMMTDRVEVLRGPSSVLYGSNAMGGVVNIVTRKPQENGVWTQFNLGGGSYGTVQTEGSNQIRKGRFMSTVSAQYERTNNHRDNMNFEQYGGFVKLGYTLSDNWSLWADADVTHFNASYPGTVEKPMLEADQSITRGNVALGIDNSYGRTSGRLSAFGNFGRHKINDGYAENGGTPQTMLFQSSDALAGISVFQSATLWHGGRLTGGVDYQRIFGHTWYTNRKTGETEDPGGKKSGRANIDDVAAYADVRQDLLKFFTVDAGIRYDHHSIAGGEWVPEAGVVYRPMKAGSLKFMASKGFRNPTVKEMYLYPSSTEELLPERLWSYELSWRHQLLDDRLTYGANVFYIHADNIIETINRKNVNTGELKNCGFEADCTWRIDNHWQVSTNHSYLYMQNPVISAPKYKGYLSGTMNIRRWNATAGLMVVSGLYTAVGTTQETETFALLHATVKYQVLKYLQLWLRGENLLNQSYEYIKGMPMPGINFMAGVNVSF